MADSDRLKGEDPHISGNIKLILLSREERSASIVQPYLTRVVISTVKDDVDIGIGAGSRTRSCQCLHLVWDGVCMWCKERREGGRGRERLYLKVGHNLLLLKGVRKLGRGWGTW